MRASLIALGLAALSCAACATLPKPAAPEVSDRDAGRAFAERACAGCHAVGVMGDSRNPHAPPFRQLGRARSDAALDAVIGEISRNGHVEMPPVYVTPQERRGLVIYLRALADGTHGDTPKPDASAHST
jgi:mono/diheme cytochrome c family protein